MKILLTLKTSFLFAIFLLFLSACNGENTEVAEGGIGGSGFVVAEGGIGGSGVVMGSITGFGSVYVNGIKYDTSQAKFYRDGKLATQEDFSLGENIEVTGRIDATTSTGIADIISYDSDIKGVVTVVSADNEIIRIMGQDVKTTPLTVLNGFEQLQDLTLENYVEVSGNRDSEGVLIADSIKLIAPFFIDNNSSIAIEGEITRVNEELKMILVQDTIVDYSAVANLELPDNTPQIGQYVEIESELNYIEDKIVIASSVNPKTPYQHFAAGTVLSVKGLVTELDTNAAFDFQVNGQPVILTEQSKFLLGKRKDISLDVILDVKGIVNKEGKLVASTVKVLYLAHEILSGFIDAIEGNKVSLQGREIIIDRSTLLIDQSSEKKAGIKVKDLQIGTRIEVILIEQEMGGEATVQQDILYTAVRINVID